MQFVMHDELTALADSFKSYSTHLVENNKKLLLIKRGTKLVHEVSENTTVRNTKSIHVFREEYRQLDKAFSKYPYLPTLPNCFRPLTGNTPIC